MKVIKLTLLLILFAAIFMLGRRSVKWIDRFSPAKHTHNYSYNKYYQLYTPMYDMYNKEVDIVMLGTSITRYADWQELLHNFSVANRGIGSDVSVGMLKRLQQIIKLKPRICVVEVGINDIIAGVPETEIRGNIQNIIDTLKHAGIKPILLNVMHVGEIFPTSGSVNSRVASLNEYINTLEVTVINLNSILAPEGVLLPEYSTYDGIHLSPAAYKVWVDAMERFL